MIRHENRQNAFTITSTFEVLAGGIEVNESERADDPGPGLDGPSSATRSYKKGCSGHRIWLSMREVIGIRFTRANTRLQIAGIAGKFIEYPFDTVKVRLQSQAHDRPLQYKGPLDCFRQSYRQQGVLDLYRGISAPLVGAAIETSSLFLSVRPDLCM